MTTWQKLLMPAGADLMLKRGVAEIGGPVVRAGDVAGARPADLVRAFGLGGEGLVFREAPVNRRGFGSASFGRMNHAPSVPAGVPAGARSGCSMRRCLSAITPGPGSIVF